MKNILNLKYSRSFFKRKHKYNNNYKYKYQLILLDISIDIYKNLKKLNNNKLETIKFIDKNYYSNFDFIFYLENNGDLNEELLYKILNKNISRNNKTLKSIKITKRAINYKIYVEII
jgi:hypothetical protein